MKTLLLAIFAVVCLAGQAALAQAPLPRPTATPKRSVAPHPLHPHTVEFLVSPSR